MHIDDRPVFEEMEKRKKEEERRRIEYNSWYENLSPEEKAAHHANMEKHRIEFDAKLQEWEKNFTGNWIPRRHLIGLQERWLYMRGKGVVVQAPRDRVMYNVGRVFGKQTYCININVFHWLNEHIKGRWWVKGKRVESMRGVWRFSDTSARVPFLFTRPSEADAFNTWLEG